MWSDDNLIKTLEKGEVVVMPTDTVYGIIGSAHNRNTVERIYKIRNRTSGKPCPILIGDINELKKFSIILTEIQKDEIEKCREPVSIILDCPLENFSYLHRGTKTLAFRLPTPEPLRKLLLKTGPLVAPSANIEGLPPAKNVAEAQKYFGDKVDLYIDGGTIAGKASKVIRLHPDGSVTVLRQ